MKEAALSAKPCLRLPLRTCRLASRREGVMKHYRVNKLARAGGVIVKKKDILAASDKDAMAAVKADPDCPVCDVLQAGKKVGTIG